MWALLFADRLVLDRFVGLHDVATFAVGAQIAGMVVVLAGAVNNAVLPVFGDARAASASARQTAVNAFVGQALFVIAAAVALIGVAPWVVPLVTGTGYSDAPRLTVLLTVANAPIAVYYGAANALTVGLGRPGLVATATVAGAGLHLITVVILAPILGVSAPPVTRFVALSAVCALLFACLARVAPEWWRDLWAALKSSWYVPPVCAAVISWAHAFPSPASGIGAMALAGYLLTLAWRRSHRLDAS